MAKFGFSRDLKTLDREGFEQVFKNHRVRFSHKYFLLLARRSPEVCKSSRLGVIISKKNIKLAVKRNQLKRLIRESFRVSLTEAPNTDIVVLARQNINSAPHEELSSLLRYFLKKLHKEILDKCRLQKSTG